jgi:ActR/RegA family two-component response regulator
MPACPEQIQPFWQTERDRIQNALDLCGGNVQEAARRLERFRPRRCTAKSKNNGLVK